MAQEFLQKLHAVDTSTWSSFFLNVDLARSLQLDPSEAQAVLTQGLQWTGTGWTTSKASKRLWELTRIPIVQDTIVTYRDCWLFALTLHWNTEVVSLTLADRAAEAAYHLHSLLSDLPMQTDHPTFKEPLARRDEEGEEEDEEQVVVFGWDEPSVSLPSELKYILETVASGERKLDLAKVLANVPRFVELPPEATGQ